MIHTDYKTRTITEAIKHDKIYKVSIGKKTLLDL